MNPADAVVKKTGHVLVVDDEEGNRELLRDLLEGQGHTVTEAADGASALALAARTSFHVILLDVMMPGLNGFDVCRQLKASPATAPIPVLLITALQERNDRIQGIEAGANDFLTKPIDTREVVIRTRNAVFSKQLHDQVKKDLQDLKSLELLRDNLMHMIVHDMRSPLMSVFGNLELLDMKLGGSLDSEDKQCMQDAMLSSRALIEMVSSLLDISRMEAGKMPLHLDSCDLGEMAGEAVHLLGGLFKGLLVPVETAPGSTRVSCDKSLVNRVLYNLLSNAAKFSPPDQPCKVVIQPLPGAVKVSVTDHGPGIDAEYHDRIFEKFGQGNAAAQRRLHSTGLGLTFCKLAVEAHGGRIGLASARGEGSTFWFVLPVAGGASGAS